MSGPVLLSVIVLQWDQVHLTRDCVASIRAHTQDLEYELVIVDNGSTDPGAAAFCAEAADRPVLLPDNKGFAGGMNAGLAQAEGTYVAFVNNDATVPADWAGSLISVFEDHPAVGIVAPLVTYSTAATHTGNHVADTVEVLTPYAQPPSAVVWIMERNVARGLGGFDERYWPAAAEDLDLAFSVWTNGLDIAVDRRVLVDHLGKGTAGEKLPNWRRTWKENGDRFIEKWMDVDQPKARLAGTDPAIHARNVATAATVAGWMKRYYDIRRRDWLDHPVIDAMMRGVIAVRRQLAQLGGANRNARGR